MADHRVLLETLSSAALGACIDIAGDEAHHLTRVKRLEAGAPIELLDGRGLRASAIIERTTKTRGGEWLVSARIEGLTREAPISPRVEVWASSPKGDRLSSMIDGLSQVGAAAWAPLHTTRTIVDPRDHKLERLVRITAEAAKQSGRAWTLEIAKGGSLAVALDTTDTLVVADASGPDFTGESMGPRVRLFIGPEGGFTPQELEQARSRGARLLRFGPHTMRIETAAVVAAAMLVHHQVAAVSSPRTSTGAPA